jgi:hypothetical protein
MEITIDKKELQKIGFKFRNIASRLLKTNYQDGMENLQRFLDYIDNVTIIENYIKKNNIKKFDIETDINKREYREGYKLPINPSDEIAYIYQLLKYCNENCSEYIEICSGYSKGNFQQWVDEFNSRVVLPFVNHINNYLEEVAIDMNLNENDKTTITIHNESGQVNLSQDESTINAVQNNQINKEIEKVFSKYKKLIEEIEIPSEEKEDTIELVDIAVDETKKDKPKKSLIKVATEKINETIKFGNATLGFVKVSEKLIDMFSKFTN